MRVALLLVLLACQKPADHGVDPAVGRWRGETGKTIELRADGTLDMDPIVTPECDSGPVAACRARQTWSRSGSIVTLSRGAVSRPVDPTGLSAQKPCECRIERIDIQFRGDEMVSGTEHAQRVK